ncbi:MAG: hypothetical protein IPL41_11850 [Micropruina sp.]|nr:hypothetical protein [Micropruina sp.]
MLRDDRSGIDLIFRAPHGIPKHDWSLDIGDAIHNIRSAFDALAWGMAHANGKQPTHPKSVKFPICETDKQWREGVKDWIGELPEQLQDRLRIVQPFTFAPPGAASVLPMVHEVLEIQDAQAERRSAR